MNHTTGLSDAEFAVLDGMVLAENRGWASLLRAPLREEWSAWEALETQSRRRVFGSLEKKGFVRKEVYMPERFGSSYVNYVLTEKGTRELRANGSLREVVIKCLHCGREEAHHEYDLHADHGPYCTRCRGLLPY